MKNRYFFLSGLPRTGSTLLSTVLSQNPAVYAGGNSALCQLMWDTQQSCRTSAYQQLAATGKFEEVQSTLCGGLPDAYYKGVEGKAVFDKCRSWTLPDNMDMLRAYVTKTPKVVVLIRSIEDIVASFVSLNEANGVMIDAPECMLEEWSEPIMRSYNGVMHAKAVNQGEFLFIDYDDMVSDMSAVLSKIYTFVGLEPFEHTLDLIKTIAPEDDSVYGLAGMHDVRSVIGKRALDTKLSQPVLDTCAKLTENLYA